MDNEPDIVARLRGGVDESIGCDCVKCEAADEIERLRAELVSTTNKLTAERDEARRELCRHEADGADCEREYAAMRGWDCFPEAEPH